MNLNNTTSGSQLNNLIPPEIKNDEFYDTIQRIAREENIKTVLEIGSSSGGGSTEAFVKGLRENPNHPTLFCMEISKPRFLELERRYSNDHFVKCYNVSSVSRSNFATEDEVSNFYRTCRTNLNYYPLEQVLSWLQQDLEYLEDSEADEHGIRRIKSENNIDFFDLVLIDGSEFTGASELEEVYGARYILLDDINTFKNHQNHQKLLIDKNYKLITQSHRVRNGYSVFRKIDEVENFEFKEEVKEQSLAKNLVRAGMTVFDVGANIGNYSVLFSKLVGSTGRVYSFEPTSSTFERLEQTIKNHQCANVELSKNAIFSNNQLIEFNEFPDEYSAWNSIGKPQRIDPKTLSSYVSIVKTEVVEAITLDFFCFKHNIEVIDYLKIDVEGAESDVLQGSASLLEKKAIYFIQFEISQKMLEGLNRSAKETFNLLINYGYECHQIEPDGGIGEKVVDSNSFHENYIAFPTLPIHFFTIVLNGEPFIRYHIDIFEQLSFEWHWHIIEGVADLKHDTAWSLQLGGQITDDIHSNGLSKDGTSEYLDELAQLYPEKITVYRKPEGTLWDGKLEMVNAPLGNISEECLLWQVDVDELWTAGQIDTARKMFVENPEKTAAFYWCWYFVGECLLISTRNCYAQNPQQEWLRTWRFKPGAQWAAHEPPILVEPSTDGQWSNVAASNPFTHAETEEQGLVFQHFAYVTAEQLQFKERYYGYKDAVSKWQSLQEQNHFPIMLRQHFSWVQDNTMVDTAESMGVMPIAQRNSDHDTWHFIDSEAVQRVSEPLKPTPVIVVDGVFFQLYKTGIARVWRSLLEEWVENGFAKHIVFLDRARSAPVISGINYRLIPPYDYNAAETDREMLQQICEEEKADLFISTYYTTPLETPSVFMAYDMIPEVMNWNLNHAMWRQKHYGIQHASAYIAISQNTARDLAKFVPDIDISSVTVAPCGVRNSFFPASIDEIQLFKMKYGIFKPYFIVAGAGTGYKNSILFFKAFSELFSRSGFDIICTGSNSLVEAEFRDYTVGSTVHMLQLDDNDLRVAYGGAVALIYPSKYEGFGLPIIEAMACGCPVITCPNASIPEVAGEAALYVQDNDVAELVNALCDVQKPQVRQVLTAKGLEQAKTFSWKKMAKEVSSALVEATLLPLTLNEINLVIFPDWTQPEESLQLELSNVIKAIAVHPSRDRITLLIDNTNIPEEDANLFLAGIAMGLFLEEELDVSEGPEIAWCGQLSKVQWSILSSHINFWISLGCEPDQTLTAVDLGNIPSLEPQNIKNIQV